MEHSKRFSEAKRIRDSNYFVTSDGIVFSNFNKTGRAMQPIRELSQHIRNGYPSVRINIGGGKIKHHTVHRIVAECFLPNEKGYDQVNHINGIKTDNRVENLEWSNASLNMIHAYNNGLMIAPGNRKGYCGDLSPSSKAVLEFDLNGNLIKRHESLSATKLFGYNPETVSKNCKHKTPQYKGRRFFFETENDTPKHQLQEVFV